MAATEGLSTADTGQSVALEPKMMAVLVQLCQHPGEVISTDSLLMRCWSGEALSDNPVHKVIAGLRKALGDTAKTSRYIETLRKRGYRLIAPVRVLGGEAPPAVSDSWRDRSPFPGLVAFDRAHAEVFFGRDDAVAMLRQRLDMQWQRGHPWVTLLGPSGSGKSSLVQAGLVPALCATRPGQIQAGWLAAGAVATADLGRAAELGLWPTLAGAMLDWAVGGTALLTGWSLASLAKALQDDPAAVFQALGAGVRRQGALRDHSAPLLILERLEALLQWPDTQASHDFIAQLALWVQARQVVVLALCRNDFYPQLAAYPALMRDKEHGAHVDLAPPDAQAIDQIIRLPAQAAGLSYGLDPSGLTRLDARLYADALKTADALPLLQYTLQQLYHRRTTAQELSWQAYAEMGGLDGAIAQVAEATLAMLPPVQQARLGHLLGRLVGLSGQDQAPTGRWVPAADLNGDDEQALVAALVQARLLVTDHQGGVPGCRVAHEALLRRWPRVTAWVAQHRVSLVLREDLQPWVQRWLDGGRTPALLLPAGGLLWQATALLAKEPALFDEAAKAFVVQSQAYWRRQRRWRRLAVAALVSLLVLAAALALHNMHLADLASQREAQSRQLTSFMLGDLADQLRPLGKLDMLARVGEQGLQVLGKDASVGPREPPEAMLQRAKALAVIGEVHGSNGTHKPEQARQAMVQAQALLASLDPAGVDVDELFRMRCRVADKLGYIAMDANKLEDAEQAWTQWAQLAQQWRHLRPGHAEAVQMVANATSVLAGVSDKQGHWSQAQSRYREAFAWYDEVLRQTPDDRGAGFNLALLRVDWARLLSQLGQVDAALVQLNAGLAWYRQRLALDPADMELRFWMATLQFERAWVLAYQQALPQSLQAMDEAVSITAQAARHDQANPSRQHEARMMVLNQLALQLHSGQDVQHALAAWGAELDPRKPHPPPSQGWSEALAFKWLSSHVAQALLRGLPDAFAQADAAEAQLATLNGDPARVPAQVLAQLTLYRFKSPHMAQDRRRADFCARSLPVLQPQIDAGAGGLVFEAWLLLRACSPHPVGDAATWARLTSGGYRPQLLRGAAADSH